MEKKTLYMVGMDSVPLWVLEELEDEKGMEPFRKLLSQGCITDMRSTLPPMTGPAWPSIYTGLEPRDHGVPDFFVMKKNYAPDIVYYNSADVPPFWQELAKNGIRCLVITPATDITLPDYQNIDMITGFPLKARTNSAELEKLMKKHMFDGEPNIEKEIKSGKMDIGEAVKLFAKSVRSRSQISLEMLNGNRYGFAYTCFTETDRLQHFVMNKKKWKGYLLPVYSEIAEYIGKISERIDRHGGRLVIVSDHGAQPIRNKFLLNSWMMSNGYLSLKEKVYRDFGKSSGKSAGYDVREKIMKSSLRSAYDKMPYRAKRVAYKVFGTVFSGAAAEKYTRMHLFDFDMRKTKAFAAISNDPVASIWINDARFSSPAVRKGGTALLKKLKADLMNAKSAEGDRMLINVFDGREYYKGTKKFIAPDLLIEARKGYTIDIFNFSKGSEFMEPEPAKSGDHIREGVFGTYPKKQGSAVRSVTDVKKFIMEYYAGK